MLRRFGGLGPLVEGFGSNVSTVWPGHGSAVQEEAPEVLRVLERLEDRPVEPWREVNGVLHPIVECQVDLVLATVLGSDHGREKPHEHLLSPAARSVRVLAPPSCGSSWLPAPRDVSSPTPGST